MCVREIREKGVRAPLALIRGGFSTTLTLCRRSESRGMCRLTRGPGNAPHSTKKKKKNACLPTIGIDRQ